VWGEENGISVFPHNRFNSLSYSSRKKISISQKIRDKEQGKKKEQKGSK
jgi:hypothetical protein